MKSPDRRRIPRCSSAAHRPCHRGALRRLAQQASVAARLGPSLPRDLESIVYKCLEKAPQRRDDSVEERDTSAGRRRANTAGGEDPDARTQRSASSAAAKHVSESRLRSAVYTRTVFVTSRCVASCRVASLRSTRHKDVPTGSAPRRCRSCPSRRPFHTPRSSLGSLCEARRSCPLDRTSRWCRRPCRHSPADESHPAGS